MDNKKNIPLSDVEWHIMYALWRNGEMTLGEILRATSDAGWSKQSLTSFLKRLEIKGAIRKNAKWRPCRYTALITRDVAVMSETKAVLKKVYCGNPVLMVTSAVNSGKLSQEDIQSLIDLLKKGGDED